MQKQKVDIDGEDSAQISIAAKNIVTHDTPNYDYGVQTNYMLF